MITVYTLKNQVEAHIVEDALKGEGIKFSIRTFEDIAYNGIFTLQKGYGQVLVESKDKQRAEEVIKNAL